MHLLGATRTSCASVFFVHELFRETKAWGQELAADHVGVKEAFGTQEAEKHVGCAAFPARARSPLACSRTHGEGLKF